jgi:hypothetical protein
MFCATLLVNMNLNATGIKMQHFVEKKQHLNFLIRIRKRHQIKKFILKHNISSLLQNSRFHGFNQKRIMQTFVFINFKNNHAFEKRAFFRVLQEPLSLYL